MLIYFMLSSNAFCSIFTHRKRCQGIGKARSTTTSFLHTNCYCIVVRCLSQKGVTIYSMRWLKGQYYLERKAGFGGQPLAQFTKFRQYLKSLEARNKKLNLRRLSITADMLKQRAANSGTKFRKLMEADFILFLRAELAGLDSYNRWFPDTLVYLGYYYRPFEVFERSRSSRFFERLRPFLANATKGDLEQLLKGYEANGVDLPRWEMIQVNPGVLMGVQNLCSKP